jgi:hypothetical protein
VAPLQIELIRLEVVRHGGDEGGVAFPQQLDAQCLHH